MILTALSVKTDDTENTGVRTRLIGAHNDWFVPGLYKNELRRTWSIGLLFAIVLFFALPVMNLMVFSNRSDSFEEYPERVLSYLSEFFNSANPFVVIFACLGGMMCAMVVAEYLFDRRKTNFVCSLPVKRQAYLLTKAAANLTWSVLAWLPSIVLMAMIALLTETMRPHFGLVFGGCFVLLISWLCIHLYFFGLTLLACCFCGTGVMGGCMLLMLGGYVPITVLSLLGLADMTLQNINTNYYLSSTFFSAISGVFRIFNHIASEKSVLFLLGCVLLGLLFTAGAVWLTVIRQSEKAGTPFVFDRVRDLVKYLLMGLAALLGSMLFEAMSGGSWTFFWMLFGCICGAVLCWMLCNTIFYKTPKMMFVGRRGMIILTVCMMLFSGLARFDVLGLDNYIPSTVMTRSISMEDGTTPITITDKSLIRMYNAMAKTGTQAYEQYGSGWGYFYPTDEKMYENDYRSEAAEMIHLGTTVWKTNYLVPLARNTYVVYHDWVQFVRALTAREDFADIYFERALSVLAEMEASSPEDTVYVSLNTDSNQYRVAGYNASGHITPAKAREILEYYRDAIAANGADALQQVYIGSLYLRLYNGGHYDYFDYPLFAAYEDVAEFAVKQLMSIQNLDSSVRNSAYETTFVCADVYYRGTSIASLTEAEYRALIDSGVLGGRFNTYDSPMTLVDTDYGVKISYRVKETSTYYNAYDADVSYNDGELVMNNAKPMASDSSVTYDEYQVTEDIAFFYGMVPAEYLQ